MFNRHKYQGYVHLVLEGKARLGLRANVHRAFYSKWSNTLGIVRNNAQVKWVSTPPDVIPQREGEAAKRIYRRTEVFGAVDNFANSRATNVGKLANGARVLIYRAELGRMFRVGMRFTSASEKK